jgi:hypothetical protein
LKERLASESSHAGMEMISIAASTGTSGQLK